MFLLNNKIYNKFIITIASSWVVGPLGVLFLHIWGYGRNEVLTSLLLALSAAAPVQLLLNEFIAPGLTANRFYATKKQILIILVATFIAVWWSLATFHELNKMQPFPLCYLILSAFSSASIWLSYRISVLYYAAVVAGLTNHRIAIYVGITPGVITLLVFVVSVILKFPPLFSSGAIFPAISQFVVLKYMLKISDKRLIYNNDRASKLSTKILILISTALIGLGIQSTILRDYIASRQHAYAAIVLVSLNLLGTLMISLSRTLYLAGSPNLGKIEAHISVAFMFTAIMAFPFAKILSGLSALFAVQFIIVVVLGLGRTAVSHMSEKVIFTG